MNAVDHETRQLMNEIFIDKILRARQRSCGEKMVDGIRLFEQGCQLMRGGIRWQFPDYSDDQVEAEFRRRLAIRRRIDEEGIYQDAGVLDE